MQIRIPYSEYFIRVAFVLFMFFAFFPKGIPFQETMQEQGVDEIGDRLELKKFYKYIGPLFGNEKQEALSAANVFVLSSDLESFGMVIIEALAHGIPVVSTNARGPLNIIENNKTGFIVNKGDVNSFADKVIKILKDDELRNMLSENARNLAYNKYRVDTIIDDIEKIYNNLLK
jgi:glycosyltransferase involved in cell wall biosynthesis